MCECGNTQLYLVFVIILLIVIIWKSNYLKKDEKLDLPSGYVGKGLVNNYQVFTSGADLRRLGQEFTSTNQGQYLTAHNVETNDTKDSVEMVCFPKNTFTPAQLAAMAHDQSKTA